ncbi:SDR family NAD(P)-dependent oxidoreductase [Henriciella litoralis]|uniref:SDR family NAD(P)-dependent oxidoreductase n=1 Tax=Henriciella litoralis TaxID=568102 RepID=UPI00146B5412|nr:SDR family oxidoreductase [Henriciella litoralis]
MKKQNVIVTGGGSGIGRAIAQKVADGGAETIILLDLDLDRTGMEETAATIEGCRVEIHALDITDDAAVDAVFDQILSRHEAIHTVYNCAGIQTGSPAWPEVSPARMRAVVSVNLIGLMFVTQKAIGLMEKTGGSILNIASTSGLNAYLSGAVYGASKAAVIHFTACNASLKESHNIRINAICPGMVNTPFLEKTGAGGKVAGWLQDRVKSGEMLTAEQVADAAVRLANDETKAGCHEVIDYEGAASD